MAMRVEHGESRQATPDGNHVVVTGNRFVLAAISAVPGLLVMGLAGLIALAGAIRLGIGRHGEAWWRPFQNSLTRSHVENLATLALGGVGVAVGAWLAIRAARRACRPA